MSYAAEHDLRAHIQDLLLNYALTHLTTDYVAYTHNAVDQLLLANLQLISTNDPTSITRDPSIPHAVALCFGLGQSAPLYAEKWIVEPDVARYIKEKMTLRGQLPSESCWIAADNSSVLPRPYDHILSRASRKATPQLGARNAASHCPDSTHSILHTYGIHEVEADDIDQTHPLNVDEVLNNRLRIDQETANLVRSVRPNRRAGPCESRLVADFLRCDSPIPLMPLMLDVPLFQRSRRPGGGNVSHSSKQDSRAHGLETVKDFPTVMAPAPLEEDEEEELYKQHMVVVNGWQAIDMSSPLFLPTPSLGSSSSQQDVDELFLESPPGTSYLRDLLDARMDDVEFPRAEKMGRARREDGQRIGEGESLISFIRPFNFSQTGQREPRVVSSPKSAPSSPRTSITASMLGHFGDVDELTVAEAVGDSFALASSDADEFAAMLRSLFKGPLPKDPRDFILHEKLDNNESLLMDVPELPPPTGGIAGRSDLPTDLSQLTLQQNTKPKTVSHTSEPSQATEASVSFCGFLKRIQGFKSLNMELNWRPFNYGSRVPTHEEVCRVDDNVSLECLRGLKDEDRYSSGDPDLEERLSNMVNKLLLDDAETHSDPSDMAWTVDKHNGTNIVWRPGDFGEDYILTAAERRRVHGYPDPVPSEDEMSQELGPGYESQSPKRPRPTEGNQTTKVTITDAPVLSAPVRSVHFDEQIYETYPPEYPETFEDSGVYLHDFSSYSQDDVITNSAPFGGLANASEGYEGPDFDGEILPDVDPIHLDLDRCSPMQFATWPEYMSTEQQEISEAPVSWPLPPIHPVEPAAKEPSSRHGKPSQLDGEVPVVLPISMIDVSKPLEPSNSQNLSPESLRNLNIPFARQSLQHFIKLRSKAPQVEPEAGEQAQDLQAIGANFGSEELPSIVVPSELADGCTLSGQRIEPTCLHRYVGSVDFIQKYGLVRALSCYSIDLVEREDIGDADLILDQDTAVLFIPLQTLPAQCDTVSATLNRLSWRFLNVLLVFEAFPPSAYYHADSAHDGLTANPFSPPVVKAVKKVKRNLGIAEACHDKNPNTAMYTSFPLSTDEAANTVRQFGDMAQSRDTTGGLLWGDRHWLDQEDEDSDERDLARIDGMNTFAAAIILSFNNLDEFLDKLPQQRMSEFGGLIGVERMTIFNRVIAFRMEAIQLPSSSPPTTSVDTSNSAQPLADGDVDVMEADMQAWSPS